LPPQDRQQDNNQADKKKTVKADTVVLMINNLFTEVKLMKIVTTATNNKYLAMTILRRKPSPLPADLNPSPLL
jgi:hypothetical protein